MKKYVRFHPSTQHKQHMHCPSSKDTHGVSSARGCIHFDVAQALYIQVATPRTLLIRNCRDITRMMISHCATSIHLLWLAGSGLETNEPQTHSQTKSQRKKQNKRNKAKQKKPW